MPADKYSFKPTPEMRTFGQLILHVAQFNNLMCSRFTSTAAPDIKDLKDTDGKDKLVAAVKDSFDFCTAALNGLDDSTLGQPAGKLGPNNLSRGGAILILGEDWYDHYSAMAIYLRLNGILPPSAQPAAQGDVVPSAYFRSHRAVAAHRRADARRDDAQTDSL